MSLDPSSQAALLAKVPALAGLDAPTLSLIAAQLEERVLADGEMLIRQGDPGDALYFVLSGSLDVAVADGSGAAAVVDRLEHGSFIGEMALLAGNRRSASVTARGPAKVARLSRAAFDQVAVHDRTLRHRVVAAIAPRLARVQLAAVLGEWFGLADDDTEAVRRLQAATEWSTLAAGEVLYRPGDPADGLYLVVSGRLGVTPEGGAAWGYQVGKGESVGELGVLGGERRDERVVALRDTHLVRVPAGVVEAHPRALKHIATTAIGRINGKGRRSLHDNGVRTLALVPAHPAAPVREVAALLRAELARSDASSLQLDKGVVSDLFDGSVPELGSALGDPLAHWLNELEAEHDFVVLLTDEANGAWAERCRRQADVVLLVGDAARTPEVPVALAPEGAQLVLLHAAGTTRPSGTAAWLEPGAAGSLHHIRSSDGHGVPRLVRRLSGRAVGLVFSGGGARGYAHIGLLRAIAELDIEIDMVAGTSMGALIAAVFALGGSHAEVERAAVMFGDRKRLLDRTLPIVALTKSRGVTDTFATIFGDARIEDLWMPFACVSANLFEAVPVEHRTGPMWEAVRASTAIPGIFTPFVRDGALLVDGAVMNAFPVDLMREMVGSGTVIASSTMSKSPPRQPYDFGPSVSGWDALAQYLRPRSRRKRYPTMIKTLMEATSVGSKHQSTAIKAHADLLIELPVQEFGKLEFDRHEELIEIGHRHALAALTKWRSAHPPGAVETIEKKPS